jgi:hypothetical protein
MAVVVAASEQEVAAGALLPDKLHRFVRSFQQDGYAVLGNAIALADLERLAPRMDADASQIVASGGQSRGEFGNGHLQLGPPRGAPFVSSQFVANPLIEQCVAAILGEGAFLSFYNGNCNSPGSGSQKIHRDSSPWGDAGSPERLQATVINVNFSTREISSENGGPEIWPASHLDGGEPEDPASQAARRGAGSPPIHLEMPVGAVAFRGEPYGGLIPATSIDRRPAAAR